MQPLFHNPVEVLAVRDKDEASLARSASGGAFCVLARAVLRDGGVVYGAILHDDYSVRHGRVDNLDELALLQGSKYVQSMILDGYSNCLNDLEEGKVVLFSGTPCQIAGLYAFLSAKNRLERYKNNRQLITCDVICHGVTSPELFKLHQQWLEKKHDADSGIQGFQFRSKRKGWGLYYYYYYYRRGERHEVFDSCDADPYYRAFLGGQLYRDSCYSCPYAKPLRVSDITIGDYWGIERQHPTFYNEKGVSVVLINSLLGKELFSRCKDEAEWIDSTMEKAMAENANLSHPTIRDDAGVSLAKEVMKALSANDSTLIFDGLLKAPVTMKGLAKRVLPASLLNTLKKIRRG